MSDSPTPRFALPPPSLPQHVVEHFRERDTEPVPPPDPTKMSDSEKLSWLVLAIHDLTNDHVRLRQTVNLMGEDFKDAARQLVEHTAIIKDHAVRMLKQDSDGEERNKEVAELRQSVSDIQQRASTGGE